MFKPGQKVVCVNAGLCDGVYADPPLTEGKVYTVYERWESDNVFLVEVPGFGYFPERFRLALTPDAETRWRRTPTRVDAGPETL